MKVENYEEAIAQILLLDHRIEFRPRPGMKQPHWHINGQERWPGREVESIRAWIAGQTGFYPAYSRARITRILNLIKQKGNKQ